MKIRTEEGKIMSYKRILSKIFINFVLIFTIIISVFPIIWVVFSAFKTNSEILSSPFSFPSSINFNGFIYVIENYNFLKYLINSLVISLSSTAISLIIYAMAGYVFAKYKFPFKNVLYALFIITLLIPAQSKAQPIFSLIMNFNLYDTLTGLSLVYISSGMAMSLFILRSTFSGLPDALNEAASIEGAGFMRIFWQIYLPLARNGLATAGILMFLNNWNEYFYASLLTSSDSARTLPVALQFFNEAFSYDYTKLFSALTLIILPGIVVYVLIQEQVQKSFASSGIK